MLNHTPAANACLPAVDQALRLAQGGYPVFPCRPADELIADRTYSAKSPYNKNGFLAATTDADQIREWWARWPDALIGVPTGKVTGLLIVDVDPDGAPWYTENAARLGCGRVHRTPRAHHLVYRMPDADVRCSASVVAPGVDIRANGGYVIWWPAHGHHRTGDMDDLTAPPAWLLDMIVAAKSNGAAKLNGAALTTGPVESITTKGGGRHDRMKTLAAAWRYKGLAPDEILALLWDHSARFFDPPHSPDDASDRDELEAVANWFDGKAGDEAAGPLEVLSTVELRRRAKLAPSPLLLDPVLPEAGALMVYGASGIGKSHIGLCVAGALALGEPFLDWTPAAAAKVLYVDGEMPLNELNTRIESYYGDAALENLSWIAARARDADLPNLADRQAQEMYFAALAADTKAVIFDNLSCLRATSADLPENSVEAWQPVGAFIRRLNRMGIAVVLIHHAGKTGTQRGSTAHVGLFDTVVALKAPGEGQPDPQAKNDIEVEFEKHRRFGGSSAAMFRAKAVGDDDGHVTWQRVGGDPLADDVVRMHLAGMSVRAMSKALGRSKNGIQKAILRAKARGALPLTGGNNE